MGAPARPFDPDEWAEIVHTAQEERRLRALAKTDPGLAMGRSFLARANSYACKLRRLGNRSLMLLGIANDAKGDL